MCETPLEKFTRVPVCETCIASPEPIDSDYFCTVCHTPFLNRYPLDEQGVCAACRAGLLHFDRAACFGFYDGALRRLIHLFKYSGMKPLARPLGDLLNRVLPPEIRFDAVIPVPLHWKRQWERGFNQAELLARQISRQRHIPVLRALRRRRSTAVQAGLASAGRRRNMAGAFAVKSASGLSGARILLGSKILLVDDVMTTGATANACALVLKRAGAKSVSLLTLARVDRRWGS